MPDLRLVVERQLTAVPKPVQFCALNGKQVVGCISYEEVKAALTSYEEGLAAYHAAYPRQLR